MKNETERHKKAQLNLKGIGLFLQVVRYGLYIATILTPQVPYQQGMLEVPYNINVCTYNQQLSTLL